jgi:hypothetical protein
MIAPFSHSLAISQESGKLHLAQQNPIASLCAPLPHSAREPPSLQPFAAPRKRPRYSTSPNRASPPTKRPALPLPAQHPRQKPGASITSLFFPAPPIPHSASAKGPGNSTSPSTQHAAIHRKPCADFKLSIIARNRQNFPSLFPCAAVTPLGISQAIRKLPAENYRVPPGSLHRSSHSPRHVSAPDTPPRPTERRHPPRGPRCLYPLSILAKNRELPSLHSFSLHRRYPLNARLPGTTSAADV